MASLQHKDPGIQQSLTATGVSPPPLDVPTGDTATTLSPSVTTTPHPSVATDGGTRGQRVNFTDSIEYPPQGKKGLPPNWCNQCLACHPFQSKKGTYHVRTFKENLAMHQAISLGKLPKVDPWAELVKAFKPPSPKPAPAQAQQPQENCTGTWKASADTDRYFERATQGLAPMDKIRAFSFFLRDEDRYQHQRRQSEMQGQQAPAPQQFVSYPTAAVFHEYEEIIKDLDDPFAKVEVLNMLLDREDRAAERRQSAMQAQQAPAVQSFGSYATAATTGGYNSHYPLPTEPRQRSPQPTGPPTKKKKRTAGEANEGSGRANKGARFEGAHTAIMQRAGGQRTSAARTPQPTANPAPKTVQRQRASSNPLDNRQRTSQTKSLRITNMPTTAGPSKTPAKGDATAANEAAPNEQNPT